MCILLVSTDIMIFLVIGQFLVHWVFLTVEAFSTTTTKTQARELYRNIYFLL